MFTLSIEAGSPNRVEKRQRYDDVLSANLASPRAGPVPGASRFTPKVWAGTFPGGAVVFRLQKIDGRWVITERR